MGAATLVFAAAALLGILQVAGIITGVDVLIAPPYWHHHWHDHGAIRTAALLAPPWLALAWALRGGAAPRGDIAMRVALLVLASFAWQVLAMLTYPQAFDRLHAIVSSPVATSYLTDAFAIADVRTWLAGFDHATLSLHSSTHPPGGVLFYYGFVCLFGAAAAPLAGALAIALLAACGVAAMWLFSRLWTTDAAARLQACALYAVLPGLVVFLPAFDQIYPMLAMLVIFAWVRATEGSRIQAVTLGALVFVVTMMAWNLLALGGFAVLHAVHLLRRERFAKAAWLRLAMIASIASGVAIGLHAVLYLLTGYDAPASFVRALATQRAIALPDRTWALCAGLDPLYFLLAAGLPLLPLLAWSLRDAREWSFVSRSGPALAWLGVATILLIDVSGLLRAETARVWLFMQPFVVVPAALALSRLRRAQRATVFVLQWLILVVLVARVPFIEP